MDHDYAMEEAFCSQHYDKQHKAHKRVKKSGFKKGEIVNYTGKGFIGYDSTHKEMEILSKADHCSYNVIYQGCTMEVYSHEIESK